MLLLLIVCFSALYFIFPKKLLSFFNLFLFVLLFSISSYFSIENLFFGKSISFESSIGFWGKNIVLKIDKLSSYFILIINFTGIVSAIYSIRYLEMYKNKSRIELSLHYFSFFVLYWSMIVLTLVQNTIAFLVIWELMSLSSFILVMFESEKKLTSRAGINYFIQMHLAVILLMIGFITVNFYTGGWTLSDLNIYFAEHKNIGLFLILFAGFGFKSGFMPFHTWLPHAHPAAPSHVSALMSGVMIKMGIYGILRIVFSLQQDLLLIGIIILLISIISGISGVSMAIVQHNLKRLLAYHSIENIGIIGIGIGTGLIGLATENQTLAALGFTGGLLHVLNHSLFKSLLFFSAGSVYQRTHLMNIDSMGGLIKKMPVTAFIFLIAALSICGLPPFNGFVSEFLIYNGFVIGIIKSDLLIKLLFLFALLGLAAIGGMAVFCFTKAFGIVFLGNPRSKEVEHANEVSTLSLIPQFLSLALILLIGFAPGLVVNPIYNIITENSENLKETIFPSTESLNSISLAVGMLVIITVLVFLIKKLSFKGKTVSETITWGCAYSGEAPKTQYTASSYAENYIHGMENGLGIETTYNPIKTREYFPQKRHYHSHNRSFYEVKVFSPIKNRMSKVFEKLAIIQTGQTQHYILYPFILIIVMIILTVLNFI